MVIRVVLLLVPYLQSCAGYHIYHFRVGLLLLPYLQSCVDMVAEYLKDEKVYGRVENHVFKIRINNTHFEAMAAPATHRPSPGVPASGLGHGPWLLHEGGRRQYSSVRIKTYKALQIRKCVHHKLRIGAVLSDCDDIRLF